MQRIHEERDTCRSERRELLKRVTDKGSCESDVRTFKTRILIL